MKAISGFVPHARGASQHGCSGLWAVTVTTGISVQPLEIIEMITMQNNTALHHRQTL